METLRLIRDFFGVEFKLEPQTGYRRMKKASETQAMSDDDSDGDSEKTPSVEDDDDEELTEVQSVVLSCSGFGLKNLSRKAI